MKKVFRKVFLSLVAAALGLALYAAWYAATPLTIERLPVDFEIARGTSLRGAIGHLESAGIHVGGKRFELLARALGHGQGIKAGAYELTQAVDPVELLDKLTRGDVMQAEVRLIEGWTFTQLRTALDEHADLRHDTTGLTESEVLERIGAKEAHPEGLFFPDTYLFGKGSSDLAVLRRAYRSMQRHLKEEWGARQPDSPYKEPYQALIMASLVEKETGRASERDLVAGVLANRLRIGMRLQVDPTVIYGLGEAYTGNLKKVHLLEDTPYNTYTRAGLPPTPIAMPGLASLRAALRPAKTDALYYVSRGDGSSEFSRSLSDHNRAVSKYQLKPRKKEAKKK